MNRLLFAFLLFCFAFCPAQARIEVVEVQSAGDIRRLLKDMSTSLETYKKVRLGGFISVDNIGDEFKRANYADYITSWRYRYKKNKSLIDLTVTYPDNILLLAAYKDPKLEKELKGEEKRALKIFRKRIERFRVPGMNRTEMVAAVLDEVPRMCSTIQKDGRCTLMLLKRGKDHLSTLRCTKLFLEALDIPTRVVSGEWFTQRMRGQSTSWLMVQLEDGSWYHLSLFNRRERLMADKSVEKQMKWERSLYPATPEELQVELPVCAGPRAFWKEAQKAYKAGKKNFSAIVAAYPGRKELKQVLTSYIAEGASLAVSDTLMPGADGDDVFVYVTFDYGEVEEPEENSSEEEDASFSEAVKRFKKIAR